MTDEEKLIKKIEIAKMLLGLLMTIWKRVSDKIKEMESENFDVEKIDIQKLRQEILSLPDLPHK